MIATQSEQPMKKENTTLLADRVVRIKPSPTLSVAAKADELQAAGKDVISLSLGEPDFDTPEHIKEAAIKAIRDGHTKYTAVDGTRSLKKAIIDKFANENQLTYQPNQILVSCGAKQSLYNLFCSILNPGDEAIVVAPYWVSYPDMIKLADGEPVIVATEFANHFKLTPAQLAAAITPKTRLVIFNSPCNPTGLAYTKQELAALGEVLLKHPQITVASDDIYEHHMWNNLPFCNILNACPELYDRTLVMNSVSKTYAMTGWRIGYAGGPAKLIAAMKKAQSQSTSSPPTPSQYAAEAALTGDQACVGMMTQAYKERHDYLYAELLKIDGVKCLPSDGTFYSFPNIEGLYNPNVGINDDMTFSEYLLNEAGIAVIPGSAFGTPGHIRICYTVSMKNIKEAVLRLNKAVDKLKKL